MSEEEQQGFVYNNPTINFITESIEQIYHYINNSNVGHAKKCLKNLIRFLDPAIKDELKDTIKEFYASTKGYQVGQPIIYTFSRKTPDDVFFDCLEKVNDSLYRAGYLSPQRFVRGS
jgi:hypothetical protein